MKSIVLLFAIAAVAACQSLNVTTSAQDYYLISQRELLHEIDLVDAQIDAVDARYADRLDTIAYQQAQSVEQILEVNRTTMPLLALSLVRKHCIQKYEDQFVTVSDAKLRFKSCYDTAVYTGSKLTQSPRSSASYARSFALVTLKNNCVNCDKSYPKNQTALELCYIKSVDSATTSVNYYLDSARADINKSLYDASVASNTAVQCSYVVEKDVLQTIALTKQNIDDCESSLDAKTSAAALIDGNTVQSLIMGKINGK